jgi:hypothetical protein
MCVAPRGARRAPRPAAAGEGTAVMKHRRATGASPSRCKLHLKAKA